MKYLIMCADSSNDNLYCYSCDGYLSDAETIVKDMMYDDYVDLNAGCADNRKCSVFYGYSKNVWNNTVGYTQFTDSHTNYWIIPVDSVKNVKPNPNRKDDSFYG